MHVWDIPSYFLFQRFQRAASLQTSVRLSSQFSTYSQSFALLLLKSQHISLNLYFYFDVRCYTSFCLSHNTTHWILFCCIIFLFNANNISIQINTRILGFLSVLLLLQLCGVSIWLALNVHVCVDGCVPVRKIHKNAGGSSLFHFLLFSYLMSGIHMLCNICYFFSHSHSLFHFPLLFSLCECI